MAENKKSFVLYADLIHTVKKMPKAKQAELFMTILQYVNDEDPQVEDLIVSLVWEPVKLQLKRDLKDWEAERVKRSEAGKRGGIKSGESRRNEANRSSASKNEANEADNVNVTVNVNDTVTVTDNVKESKEEITHPLQNSNLFRQPKIPTFEEVHRAFLNNGGTKEMAQAFFDKNNSVDWFLRGSPITNFNNLVPSFIINWKQNEKNAKGNIRNNKQNAVDDLIASTKSDYFNFTRGEGST